MLSLSPFYSSFGLYCGAIIATLLSSFSFFSRGIFGMESADRRGKSRCGQIGKVDGTRNWREKKGRRGTEPEMERANEFQERFAKFRENFALIEPIIWPRDGRGAPLKNTIVQNPVSRN